MVYEMYAALNDFYNEIGLSNTDMGDELGWNIDDGLLEISYGAMLINSKSDGITYMHHSLFQAIQLKPILILHCTLELEKQARHGLVHLKQKLET